MLTAGFASGKGGAAAGFFSASTAIGDSAAVASRAGHTLGSTPSRVALGTATPSRRSPAS